MTQLVNLETVCSKPLTYYLGLQRLSVSTYSLSEHPISAETWKSAFLIRI